MAKKLWMLTNKMSFEGRRHLCTFDCSRAYLHFHIQIDNFFFWKKLLACIWWKLTHLFRNLFCEHFDAIAQTLVIAIFFLLITCLVVTVRCEFDWISCCTVCIDTKKNWNSSQYFLFSNLIVYIIATHVVQ